MTRANRLLIDLTAAVPVANDQIKVVLPVTFPYAHTHGSGDDIQFRALNGTTVLPHWLQNWNASGDSTFWVKAPVGATQIYVYYNDATATNPSNGNAVFEFFDNFPTRSAGFYSGFVRDVDPVDASLETVESGGQHDPCLIKEGSTYYRFYGVISGGNAQIALRTCPAADFPRGPWTYQGVVLTYGEQSGVDDLIVTAPKVMKLDDNSWRMDYHGYNGTKDQGCVAFCSAANFPGLTPGQWVKSASNPILPASGSEYYIHNEIVVKPSVAGDGLWHVLAGVSPVDGNTWTMKHYTSSDGLSFTPDAGNPVLSGTGVVGDFDSYGVHPIGQAIKRNGTFWIPYQGYDNQTWRLGVFTTTDFVTFTKPYSGPLLLESPTASFCHGSVENPGTWWDSGTDTIYWFFVGSANFLGSGLGGGDFYKIGLAISSATETEVLDPSKWKVLNFDGAGVLADSGVKTWPRLNAGAARLISPLGKKTGILSLSGFDSGIVEASFSASGISQNYRQVNVGFGNNSTHYIEGQRIYETSQKVGSEHTINGSYADSRSAGSFNSGFIKVVRTGSVSAVYIKQNLGDAWTALETGITDAMTGLSAMLSAYDNLTYGDFDDVFVRKYNATEPVVSSIGSEEAAPTGRRSRMNTHLCP